MFPTLFPPTMILTTISKLAFAFHRTLPLPLKATSLSRQTEVTERLFVKAQGRGDQSVKIPLSSIRSFLEAAVYMAKMCAWVTSSWNLLLFLLELPPPCRRHNWFFSTGTSVVTVIFLGRETLTVIREKIQKGRPYRWAGEVAASGERCGAP